MAPVSQAAAFAAMLLLAGVAPVGAQTVAERLAVCLACHGDTGHSKTPEVPSLGGQPEFYLTVQLVMFRERLRPIEPMTSGLKGLSDRDLRAMAALIAKLPPPPAADQGDAARMAVARTLAEANRCNFCHARDYGGQENVPRLSGQR